MVLCDLVHAHLKWIKFWELTCDLWVPPFEGFWWFFLMWFSECLFEKNLSKKEKEKRMLVWKDLSSAIECSLEEL